ncbi:unnamed protein product [Gordionus sp. m RMFG-2023]
MISPINVPNINSRMNVGYTSWVCRTCQKPYFQCKTCLVPLGNDISPSAIPNIPSGAESNGSDVQYHYRDWTLNKLLPEKRYHVIVNHEFGPNDKTVKLILTNEFLECDINTLCRILCDDTLNVSSEMSVFVAAWSWIYKDSSRRQGYAPYLMRFVRLHLLPPVKFAQCKMDMVGVPECIQLLNMTEWAIKNNNVPKLEEIYFGKMMPRKGSMDKFLDFFCTPEQSSKLPKNMTAFSENTNFVNDINMQRNVFMNNMQQFQYNNPVNNISPQANPLPSLPLPLPQANIMGMGNDWNEETVLNILPELQLLRDKFPYLSMQTLLSLWLDNNARADVNIFDKLKSDDDTGDNKWIINRPCNTFDYWRKNKESLTRQDPMPTLLQGKAIQSVHRIQSKMTPIQFEQTLKREAKNCLDLRDKARKIAQNLETMFNNYKNERAKERIMEKQITKQLLRKYTGITVDSLSELIPPSVAAAMANKIKKDAAKKDERPKIKVPIGAKDRGDIYRLNMDNRYRQVAVQAQPSGISSVNEEPRRSRTPQVIVRPRTPSIFVPQEERAAAPIRMAPIPYTSFTNIPPQRFTYPEAYPMRRYLVERGPPPQRVGDNALPGRQFYTGINRDRFVRGPIPTQAPQRQAPPSTANLPPPRLREPITAVRSNVMIQANPRPRMN